MSEFFDSLEVTEKTKFEITEDMIFVFGDVETTGFFKEGMKMTEIALIATDHKFEVVDKFITLVNPEQELTPKIIELTHITQEMVDSADTYDVVIPKMMEFFYQFENKHIIFVAHNAPFDISFLNHASQLIESENAIEDWIDTVSLARELYPFWKNHKLDTCAKKFDFANDNHHRAENDTILLMNIGIRLISEFTQDGLNPINFRTSKNLHYKN